jgi:hypothetical protein
MERATIPLKLPSLNEEWRPVKNYEKYYMVSNFGNVKALKREWVQRHYSNSVSHYVKEEKLMKLQEQRNGYLVIGLKKEGKQIKKLVHRLVAEAFLENPNNYKYINHIDGDPKNNNVKNLEWCTQSYNIQYAYNMNRKIPPNEKKVEQVDAKTNQRIQVYRSAAEAERITGFNNISACCRGVRQMAGGCKWRYI